MTRALIAFTTAIGVGGITMLGLAGPAHASGGPAPRSGETAPSCILRDVADNNSDVRPTHVALTNNCGQTLNVQVIWNWATTNSPCYTMNPGERVDTYAPQLWSTYNKTVLC